MLYFWDCKVRERKKISLKITNKHPDLPFDFSFSKISFFTALPNSGIIPPINDKSNRLLVDNSVTIDIIFHPESFGNCNDVIIFKYISNMFSFPLRVLGTCKQIGTSEVKKRGPEATANDFMIEATVVPDELALNYTEKQRKVKLKFYQIGLRQKNKNR
jgi:hypothetical protein